MANIDVSKQETIEPINSSGFFKRQLVIDWEDINAGGTYADNDTATFTIAVNAGELVKDVAVEVVEDFDDSGSGDELNVTVGDGDDADGHIASAQLHADDTAVTYVANTGALLDNENGKVYTADDTLDIVLTPNVSTGTDYSLNELTQGKFIVKVWGLDLSK